MTIPAEQLLEADHAAAADIAQLLRYRVGCSPPSTGRRS